jgi:RNA polymerase primary sigma factor
MRKGPTRKRKMKQRSGKSERVSRGRLTSRSSSRAKRDLLAGGKPIGKRDSATKSKFAAKLQLVFERSKEAGVVPSEQIERLLHRSDFDMNQFEDFLDSAAGAGVEVEIPEYDDEKGPTTRETGTTGPKATEPARAIDPLNVYLKEISRYPLLTPAQEIELSKAVLLGDQEARRKMILSNLRLVVRIARSYQNRGVDLLDLIEEGNLGLIAAVERFDPSRGRRFSTYASWWIRQSVVRGIANFSRTVRIPIHMLQLINRYITTDKLLSRKLGTRAAVEEIAFHMGEPLRKVERVRILIGGIKTLDYASISEAYGELSQFEPLLTVPSPEEMVELQLEHERLEKLMGKLPGREEKILRIRYGFHDGRMHTLAETGALFGVSRERVRQIEKRALARLRRFIESRERHAESEQQTEH